jgi:cobalt-zinc-cadmium efflux system outer membrane protein
VTEIAVQENLDLLAAKYNISAAEADEITAGLWNNPSILFDTVFQPFGSNWNQTNTGGPGQYDIILSYPLDLSGKRSSGAKSAHAATTIAQATYQDSVRQKVLQVRLAYMDLLDATYQLSLSREREDSMGRLVKMLENRIGGQGRLPLLQRRAQLGLDQAFLDSRQRESAVRVAKMALAGLLNMAPNETSINPASNLRDMQIVAIPPKEALEKQALETRPDLQALKLTLGKTDLDESLARAQAWDNFTITAGISHQNGIAALPGAYSWNAGLTIPLPFFNHNQGNVQKAIVTRSQTEKQVDSLVLSIRQELATDVEQLRLNESLIRDYEDRQLENARKVRDSQQTLFGTGGSALLDYFDAVNAYQATVSAYYDVVTEYRRGLARLNAALGKDILQ